MQHIFAQTAQHKPIAIDVAGEPQGVVIPEAAGFRFMAVRLPVFPLDGKIFATIEEAQRAAASVVDHIADE